MWGERCRVDRPEHGNDMSVRSFSLALSCLQPLMRSAMTYYVGRSLVQILSRCFLLSQHAQTLSMYRGSTLW